MMHRPVCSRFTSKISIFRVVAQSTIVCLGLAILPIVQAVPPSQDLLSKDAKGWLSFPDYKTMSARFDQTQWGIVLADARLAPFRNQLRQQFNDQLATAEHRLGVRIADLGDVATGEIAAAALQWGDDEKDLQRGFVLIIDVTKNEMAAQNLLNNVIQSLQKKGAKIETKGNHISARLKAKNLQTHNIEFYLNKTVLIVTDHIVVLNDVLARLKNPAAADSLARSDAFQTVQKQLDNAAPNLKTDSQWFVIPLDYSAIVRDANEGPRRRRRDRIKVLRRQGFDAIEAAGGRLGFAQQGRDSTMVSFIHAPQAKRKNAVLALNFPPAAELPPDEWVDSSAASSSEVSWDIAFAFAQLKSLVDDWLDQPGYAQALLSEMAEDPRGLQIDIEKDLIAQMKGRLSFSRNVVLPVTETSEKIVISIPLVSAPVLQQLFKARLPKDTGIKHHISKKKHDVWELLPPKRRGDAPPRQGFGPRDPKPANVGNRVKRTINPGITVAYGRFFYCSDWMYLVDLVDANWKQRNHLAADNGYQGVMAELGRMAAQEQGGISSSQFIDIAGAYRINYELMRLNKIAKSESFLVRLIRAISREDEPEDESTPKKRINGENLPPFAAIEGKFGLGGYHVYTRPDGWMIYGCVLPPTPAAH